MCLKTINKVPALPIIGMKVSLTVLSRAEYSTVGLAIKDVLWLKALNDNSLFPLFFTLIQAPLPDHYPSY